VFPLAAINAKDVLTGDKIGTGAVDLAALQVCLVIAMAALPVALLLIEGWAKKLIAWAACIALFSVNFFNAVVAVSHELRVHDGRAPGLADIFGVSEAAMRGYLQIQDALGATILALAGSWGLLLVLALPRHTISHRHVEEQ
jgi:hypothetical protein